MSLSFETYLLSQGSHDVDREVTDFVIYIFKAVTIVCQYSSKQPMFFRKILIFSLLRHVCVVFWDSWVGVPLWIARRELLIGVDAGGGGVFLIIAREYHVVEIFSLKIITTIFAIFWD